MRQILNEKTEGMTWFNVFRVQLGSFHQTDINHFPIGPNIVNALLLTPNRLAHPPGGFISLSLSLPALSPLSPNPDGQIPLLLVPPLC